MTMVNLRSGEIIDGGSKLTRVKDFTGTQFKNETMLNNSMKNIEKLRADKMSGYKKLIAKQNLAEIRKAELNKSLTKKVNAEKEINKYKRDLLLEEGVRQTMKGYADYGSSLSIKNAPGSSKYRDEAQFYTSKTMKGQMGSWLSDITGIDIDFTPSQSTIDKAEKALTTQLENQIIKSVSTPSTSTQPRIVSTTQPSTVAVAGMQIPRWALYTAIGSLVAIPFLILTVKAMKK